MTSSAEGAIVEAAHDWDRAMVTNDIERIGQFMSADWMIVGPDGRVTDRDRFLAVIRSGELSHDVMETHDVLVRVHGECAILIARGVSSGSFHGQRFHLAERMTCMFVRRGGKWECVSTHLSSIA